MPDLSYCPSPETLRQFALGHLAEGDIDAVETHLSACADCLDRLQKLSGDDELIKAIQRARSATDEAAGAERLTESFSPSRAQAKPAGHTKSDSSETEKVPTRRSPSSLHSTGWLAGSASAPRTANLAEGSRLGKYLLKSRLGGGGMGDVYLAEDDRLGRAVALKVMRPEYATRADHRKRFMREARLAAQLEHDHIVPIFEVGEEGSTLFIAMPLLRGRSLEDRLRADPRLALTEVLRIGREIAEGLAAAHEAGLVHRDIKPANIWLESRGDGRETKDQKRDAAGGQGRGDQEKTLPPRTTPLAPRVKLLDFGLARPVEDSDVSTQFGAFLGTAGYAAPEQVNGMVVDARADLFSLGVVLYRMATGSAPFEGKKTFTLLQAEVQSNPPTPDVLNPALPPALANLIMRLLAKDPNNRPQSAGAVADELRALEKGDSPKTASQPTRLAEASGHRPESKWSDKRRSVILVALLAIAVSGLGIWWVTRPNNESRTPIGPKVEPRKMTGFVDIVVWSKQGQEVSRLRLSEPGALPLRLGDQIRVEAEVEPPAYVYLFWIDTEGKAEPVYPWQPGKWGTRPDAEKPVAKLELPATIGKGWKISGDREGMETLILLARDTPLPEADADLQAAFAGLLEQRPVQSWNAAVWFENGAVVKNDRKRDAQFFVETDVNDPVLRLQDMLQAKLQPLADFTTAVSFARKGSK